MMTLFIRKYKYIMQRNNVAITVEKTISFRVVEVCLVFLSFILKTHAPMIITYFNHAENV